MKTPRLADVQCRRLRLQPGNRLVVRTTHRLEPDAAKKLRRTIQKWAGCEVEVLIYCVLDMDIQVEQ